MEKDTEQTRVIFRKFKDGDIIALFPEILETSPLYDCLSYQHIGQHGGAEYSYCIKKSVPATPEEYKDLAAELESIGYNLLIRKRR